MTFWFSALSHVTTWMLTSSREPVSPTGFWISPRLSRKYSWGSTWMISRPAGIGIDWAACDDLLHVPLGHLLVLPLDRDRAMAVVALDVIAGNPDGHPVDGNTGLLLRLVGRLADGCRGLLQVHHDSLAQSARFGVAGRDHLDRLVRAPRARSACRSWSSRCRVRRRFVLSCSRSPSRMHPCPFRAVLPWPRPAACGTRSAPRCAGPPS